MTVGSDSFCAHVIQEVMKRIWATGIDVVIYEPTLKEPEFFRSRVLTDLVEFKECCDVILANRMVSELADIADKVYTCDLFGND